MGFSESDSSRCKKHTNQKQLPGICPSCLTEKLSKLSTTPHSMMMNHHLSSSSPTSTALNSAVKGRTSTVNHLRRSGSKANTSNGLVMLSSNGLKKSKSLSCAPLSKNNKSYDGGNKNSVEVCKVVLENDQDGKKKGGLLKRLMNSTSKKSRGSLMNSNSNSNSNSSSSRGRSSSYHTSTMVVKN